MGLLLYPAVIGEPHGLASIMPPLPTHTRIPVLMPIQSRDHVSASTNTPSVQLPPHVHLRQLGEQDPSASGATTRERLWHDLAGGELYD